MIDAATADRPKRGRPSAVLAEDKAARGQALIGIPTIAAFVRILADDPDIPATRVARWLERGHLPAAKIGALWVAWKPTIRAHFSTATNMKAANGREAAE
jgi:hypothetical protein